MRFRYAVALFLLMLALGAIGMGKIVQAQGGDSTRRAPPVTLTDAQDQYSLAPHLELLRDPTQKLTLQDVSSPAFADRFVPNSQSVPNLGITDDAVWVRWRVRNDSATNEWRLALNEARLGQIALYIPSRDARELCREGRGT